MCWRQRCIVHYLMMRCKCILIPEKLKLPNGSVYNPCIIFTFQAMERRPELRIRDGIQARIKQPDPAQERNKQQVKTFDLPEQSWHEFILSVMKTFQPRPESRTGVQQDEHSCEMPCHPLWPAVVNISANGTLAHPTVGFNQR